MLDRAGQQLGNYRLVRLLGQGGFADVYLGEHIHLKTQAAIKVLQMRLAGDETQGFLAEAQTIAHLDHPHIVRVLDFGIDPAAGTPFLVMAFAPNGTLRQRHPKGQQLPPPLVVSYVKQIASALHYAHNQNLIHRDVKPENMLLDRNNNVLLSDFGIALVTQSSRNQSTKDPVGTISYMAPEQLQGKPSAASDQYALAISVYEWLAGERPFQGSFYELFSQHMAVQPPSLRSRRPDIPADAEQVIFTALAKEPQRRFISIEAFANALEQAFAPTQLQANPAAYLQNNQGPAIPPPPPVMPHYTPPPPPIQHYAPQGPATPSNPNQPAYMPQGGLQPPSPSSPSQPPYGPGAAFAPQRATPSNPNQPPLLTPSGGYPPQRPDQALHTPNSGFYDRETIRGTDSNKLPTQPTTGSFSDAPPPIPPKRRTSGKLIALVSVLLAIVIIAVALLAFLPGLLKGNNASQTNGTGGNSATSTATTASNPTPTPTTDTTTATPGVTPTASPGATPTSTSASTVAAGTLLYTADWSQGMNGWGGSAEWTHVNNGTLGSDGSDDGSSGKNYNIWASTFQPSTANYAVEAKIQYVRSTETQYQRYEFGILIRGDGDKNGFEVGIEQIYDCYQLATTNNAFIAILQDNSGDTSTCGKMTTPKILTKAYPLDTKVHTYRVEVNGNEIKMLFDGNTVPILDTTDNHNQPAGQVGLRDIFGDINVLSYKVYAL